MNRATTRFWALGTAFVGVLLLAGAWLLAIDPVLAQASDDRAATEDTLARNDLLELEIAKLKEQSTHLDEYRGELASLRTQIPATSDVSGLTTYLQGLAESAGVAVTVLEPGTPQVLVPTGGAATTDSGTQESTTATDGTESTGGEAATGTADGSMPGLYTLGINITTVGGYDATMAFLRSLQTGDGRIFLVTSIDAQTQDAEGASGGRPATAVGDIELALSGYAYVLPDGSTTSEESTVEGDLPVPSTQANPFAPVG